MRHLTTQEIKGQVSVMLTGLYQAKHYPDKLRRVKYHDKETDKTLVFLTNNFTLPAMTIDELYGDICSYGQLSEACNFPHAVRALASNPIPVIIPCHRVVASDGRLTGFSAPGGESTKRALIKMEGIEFKGLRVVTKQLVINRIPDQ